MLAEDGSLGYITDDSFSGADGLIQGAMQEYGIEWDDG